MALGGQTIEQNIQHRINYRLRISCMSAVKPHRKPLNNRKNCRANNRRILLFNHALGHALINHIAAQLKDFVPALIDVPGMICI